MNRVLISELSPFRSSKMAAISPSLFHKIASVSGALAIALGAYGAHGIIILA